MLMQITKSCSSESTAPGAKHLRPPRTHQRRPRQRMAHQHGVVTGGVEPPVDRVVQRYPGQRPSAIQQQVLIEHVVAFVGRLRNLHRAGGASVPEPEFGLRSSSHCPAWPAVAGSPANGMPIGGFDRLVEIGEDIADVFDAHREPDHFRRHAGIGLLLDRELLVRRRCRVNHQRLGVADVGHQREEFQRIDQLLPGLVSALDAEGDERSLCRWADTSSRAAKYELDSRPG